MRTLFILLLLFSYSFSSGLCAEDVPEFFGIKVNEVVMGDMRLKVNSFRSNQSIPTEYTCDGNNSSPEISWSNLPEETESLAFSVTDLDAPSGNFIHWLIYDIDPDAGSIPAGGPLPIGAEEVENDFGRAAYGGPCPSPGDGEHRYFFTLYALDRKYLDDVTRDNFFSLVWQYAIDSIDVVGLYSSSH